MNTAIEIFEAVNKRIEAIADENEQLYQRAIVAPRQEIDQILARMIALGNEHECLIPHWRSLRSLLNTERLQSNVEQ